MRVATVAELAAAVRGRRLELGWSQGELARQARVSRLWVNEFETGKETASLATVLKVFDALGLTLTATLDADRTPGAGVDLDEHLRAYRNG